jgi:hypothetical protein
LSLKVEIQPPNPKPKAQKLLCCSPEIIVGGEISGKGEKTDEREYFVVSVVFFSVSIIIFEVFRWMSSNNPDQAIGVFIGGIVYALLFFLLGGYYFKKALFFPQDSDEISAVP